MSIPELSQTPTGQALVAPGLQSVKASETTHATPEILTAAPADHITVIAGRSGQARTSASLPFGDPAAIARAPGVPPTPEQAAKARATVDKAMQLMGLDLQMQTDPQAMRDILATMKLLDFETSYPPIKAFLAAAKTQPQPLGPLLTAIREGLVADHPAVVEFLDKAIQENWLEASDQIKTSAQVALILEALTAAMANNNDFAKELQDHFLKKRAEYGIQTNSALRTLLTVGRASGSLFFAAKTVSVDPAITFYRLIRERKGAPLTVAEVEKLYAAGKLTYPEKRALMPSDGPEADPHEGLRINIYEAGTTEYSEGFAANAQSAHALCESAEAEPHPQIFKKGSVLPKTIDNAFYRSLGQSENYFPTNDFSQDWVSLYETWNMAFVLSEMDDLQILMPKLLIPSVLSANKENYLTARVMALWLSINTLMFRKLDQVEAVPPPAHKAEMAKAWGEINQKYARALAQSSAGEDPEAFLQGFNKHFSWPRYNLLKMIANY